TAGFGRRSGLTGSATLTLLVFICPVAFVAGFASALVALGAALLAVELGGVIPLATLAALAALLGVAALGNFAVSGIAGFAIRATFSAFLSETGTGFVVALVRFVVVGAVSQSVACFAVMGCAFFAISLRFTEDLAGWTETAGSAALSATTAFAALVAFGLGAGPFVAVGFTS
ncbi:MAG TPA: hypothetical protein VFS83_06005, partial [Ktedonobacterales bacterium]|nr:hypothetical protein [Ktedonobacterales bacterium]